MARLALLLALAHPAVSPETEGGGRECFTADDCPDLSGGVDQGRSPQG